MRFRIPVFVAATTLSLNSIASAQSVDEVIGKYLQAHGIDKWRAVQSMRVTATMDAQGHSITMTTVSKRPNLVRQSFTLNGNTIVQGYDGSTVWQLNPQVSPDPQRIEGPRANAIADQADFDLVLFDYKKKGYTAELAGRTKIGDRDVYDVKVTRKEGVVQDYFIDAATFLEDRVTTEITHGGQTLNSRSEPSDFRNVDGVMMSFTVTQQVAGLAPVVLHVQKIEFNVPAPDELFRMPAGGR